MFKVGDKVVIMDNYNFYSGVKVGDIAEITEIDPKNTFCGIRMLRLNIYQSAQLKEIRHLTPLDKLL